MLLCITQDLHKLFNIVDTMYCFTILASRKPNQILALVIEALVYPVAYQVAEGFKSHKLKGTVSRDFSSAGFFIKQLRLVPMGMPRNDFKFFRIFVELFVFVIDSPVMNTPGSRFESLKYGNFFKHKSHAPM